MTNYQSAYNTIVLANQSCGGNTYFSVYCGTSSSEDCTNIPVAQSAITNDPNARNAILADSKPLIQCAFCSDDSNACGGNVLTPHYDYFPKNDPQSCIKFCSVQVRYINGEKLDIREPTKYAITTWRLNQDHNFPMCRCTNDLIDYSPVDDQYCDTPCPGDPSKTCGSSYSEKSLVYATVYCATGPCDTSTETTTAVPTSTESTTSNNPCIQTGDTVTEPCGDVSKTTEVVITTSSTSISVSTTPWPNSTISTPQTDQMTSDVVQSTTLTPTSMPSMPPDIGIGCHIVCKGSEKNNGRKWEVCAGDSAEKDCGHQGSWGKVIWTCMSNGEFETDQPDYTGCHSNWVGDLENQTSTINDTVRFLLYLHIQPCIFLNGLRCLFNFVRLLR